MSGQIRNIEQTRQDREVIKQAPDIVVYIENQDYLVNPYLGPQGVAVPFNDFVTSFQGSYDIEGTIPSGSITLTVPNDKDYLFCSPGGNNLLRTMSSIRVFAKGFYLSAAGNSMYYQVFHGYISNISYERDGKATTISLQCFGSLGILERMQIEQNPAVQSSSGFEAQVYDSTTANLDPYDTMASVFLYGSMVDGFERASIDQALLDNTNPYYKAVNSNYVARWQAYLMDLTRDTHIFGCTPQSVSSILTYIQTMLKAKSPNAQTPDMVSQNGNYVGAQTESQVVTTKDLIYQKLRGYHPELAVGSIQLFNGNVVSRLERLRYAANLANFELYQDLDGAVIAKPPVYNLDVTVVTDKSDTASADADPALKSLLVNNPFIVQLSEIITESESEDEAAVRLTRILARGDFTADNTFASNATMGAVVEEIDVQKLGQFGLRTEPPKVYQQFGDDKKYFYSYAVAEMARANRGLHVINITIPLRPELKLGIPLYLPHKDVYGYIKSIAISYSQGSNATMSVMLDSIRHRPMFPTQQTDADGNVINMLNPQPNLVTAWTSVGGPAASSPSSGTSLAAGLSQAVGDTPLDPSVASLLSSASLANTPVTVPTPPGILSDQDVQMRGWRQTMIGNSFGTKSDTPTACWNIQNDKDGAYTLGGYSNLPQMEDWTKRKLVDSDYLTKMLTVRPYTDAKGYELIGPFPWGRWVSLTQVLQDLVIGGTFNSVTTPVSANPVSRPSSAALLFTGEGQPAPLSSAGTLQTALQAQASVVASNKVFELTWSNTGQGSDASGLMSTTVSGGLIGSASWAISSSEASRTQAFVKGQPPASTAIKQILASNANLTSSNTNSSSSPTSAG